MMKIYISLNVGTAFNCHLLELQAPKGHGSDFFKDCPLNALSICQGQEPTAATFRH